MKQTEIYTDGASSLNPIKIAGWASALIIPDKKPIVFYGHLPDCTNNQGELLGVLMGVVLYRLSNASNCVLWTDSQYSIGVLRKGNNYFTNEEIIELGKDLLKEIPYSKLPIKWVKGHSGILGNELADKYAKYGKFEQIMKPNDITVKYFHDYEQVMDYITGALLKWQ